MASRKLQGADKAAIVLMSLGEEAAAEIFAGLSESEARRIGLALARLGRVEQSVVDGVLLEFKEHLERPHDVLVGNGATARRLFEASFKGDVPAWVDGFLKQAAMPSLPSLERADPKMLASVLRREHPQTMAAVLAYLDPQKCGQTLKLLPESLHTELVTRIARLDAIEPDALTDVDEAIARELDRRGQAARHEAGGVESIAAMLNTLDKAAEQAFLAKLDESDPELAEAVRQLMFRFDDLVKIDDRGMQELLKQTSAKTLKLALKACAAPVKAHVLKNMSQRAARLLEEDLAAMPKVRLDEVHAAQAELAQLARRLADAGSIVIASKDEQYV
jgi:flagellar motor switch protein FliG